MRREDIRWISASHKVNEKHISFENHKTWCLTELVAEKAVIPRRRRRKYNGDDEDEPAEASAVYIAKQTGGPKTASEAVIRVRMQIPSSETEIHSDPKLRANEASTKLSVDAQGEITALERLTAAKCPYTPKLLSTKRTKQNDTMWVPGGYLIYILMERLPGRPITAFFDSDGKRPAMTLSQRDEVRKAFKTALSTVFESRLCPFDCKLDNLLWDEATKKCYIVDLERCDDYQDDPGSPLNWSDNHYIYWGLTRRVNHVLEW